MNQAGMNAPILFCLWAFYEVAFGQGLFPNYGPHPNFPTTIYDSHPQYGHISSNNLLSWTDLGGDGYSVSEVLVKPDGTILVYWLSVSNHFFVRRTDKNGDWYSWLPVEKGAYVLTAAAATAGTSYQSFILVDKHSNIMVSRSTTDLNDYTSLKMKTAERPAVAGTDDGTFYYFAVGLDGVPHMSVRKPNSKDLSFRQMDGIQAKSGVAAVDFSAHDGHHVMVFCVKIGEWYTGYLHYAEIINGQWNGTWVNTNQFTNELPTFSKVWNGFAMAVGDGTGRTLVRSYAFHIGWSAWTNLGGVSIYRPAIASPGRGAAVLIVGPDRQVQIRLTYDGSNWMPWKSIGGPSVSEPSAILLNNIIHVFAISDENTLVHYAMPLN